LAATPALLLFQPAFWAFVETFPMLSEFITAHPPAKPGLPAVRYALKEFMEEQAPSNFFKERWAASYDPARKVTYVSWFLGTVTYFLEPPLIRVDKAHSGQLWNPKHAGISIGERFHPFLGDGLVAFHL
jgi:hypothetical protein